MLRLLRVVLLLLTAASVGCVPLTRYRQTLLTLPATPPTSFGAPLEEGIVAGSGFVAGYSGFDQATWVVGEDTPGVLVPFGSYGGQVRAGIAPSVEIGASFERAGAQGARRSAHGVLPLQGSQTATAIGTHATVGHTWEGGFGIGLTLDAAVLTLPWTRYELRDDALLSADLAADSPEELYDVDATGTVRPIRVRLTHAVSYRAEHFDAAFGLALAPQTTNRGFSNTLPKVLLVGPVSAIPAADAGLRFGNLRLGTQVWFAANTHGSTGGAYAGLGGRVLAEIQLDRR
jgi:hypothetical protein